VIVAAITMKADAKEIIIGGVGVIGGWLGHSAVSGQDAGHDVVPPPPVEKVTP